MKNENFLARVDKGVLQILLIDAFILLLMLVLPAISHFFSFPLYKFEPMRIMVLTGLLLSTNKKNAYWLAFLLPLFSFITTGHPLFLKSILMISELTINVFLFSFLIDKKMNAFFAMFTSIILSKAFYYSIKLLLIKVGLMATNLVDTNIGIQILISCSIALLFAVVYKKRSKM